jgi:putative DNA primase/helicase
MTIYTPTADIAHEYHKAGLAILPLRTDGSKAPLVKWSQSSWHRHAWEELAPYWERHNPCGIGILTGNRNVGYEVLDFDCHHAVSVFPKWAARIDEGLLAKLVIVATPSGGRHVYYRCVTTEGSKALAREAPKPDHDPATLPPATIELKSEGAYIVAPGSPAETHPDRKLYDLLQGDPRNPSYINDEKRERLHTAARALNLYCPKPTKTGRKIDRTKLKGRKLPGDIFNQQADWSEVLEPHGWTATKTKGDTTYWTKPSGTGGHTHATTNYGGADCLYIFTSDPPKHLEANRPYSKFAVWTALNHDGDFHKAAHALTTKHL